MKVTVRNLVHTGPYDDDIADFRRACGAAGVEAALEVVPPPELRADAEWSRVVLQIDPQTLDLLAKYATAGIALWKAHGYAEKYVDAFFKAAVDKLGGMAGAKIGEAIAALWACIVKRIKHPAPDAYPSVEFKVVVEYPGTTLVAQADGFSSDTLKDLSEEDLGRQLSMRPLLYVLLPIVEEFVRQAASAGVELHTRISAFLTPADDDDKVWSWELELAPIGHFVLDARGVLRAATPLKCFARVRASKAAFLSEGIAIGDIETIVRQYQKKPDGIRPLF